MMINDLMSILEHSKDSLNNMQKAFYHMAQYEGKKLYIHIVQSTEYANTNSVQSFFTLLAPYLKSPDCSLLKALVKAAKCEEAMERLNAYLDISMNVKLDNDFSLVTERPSPAHASSATSPPPVVRSEPVDHGSVPVTTTVAVEAMRWGVLRKIQSLICGIFRIPLSFLQYNCVEPGSVTIKWAITKTVAQQIESIVLDDGDLKLFLQENIVSIKVGMKYTVTTGKVEYWKVHV